MSMFDKYDLVDVNQEVKIPEQPKTGLTVVFGGSGTGKSTILKEWGMASAEICESTPIYKLFDCEDNAEKFLIASGLRSVPCWKRTLKEVSKGERHRAEVAVLLNRGELFIDEFTSLVDRNTARALCCSLNKLKLNITVATCHKDVLEWLNYDNAYNTDSCAWIDRGSHRHDREFKLEISPCDTQAVWEVFKKHHYLSGKINKAANSWVATHNGIPVAMCSVIAFPNAHWKDGWREHRTVVLPEFQGMGIGNAISNEIAKHIVSTGARYFSKTAHPSMGLHREKSSEWKATSKNKVIRNDYNSKLKTKEDGHKLLHSKRSCFSHEFIG